MGTTTTTTVAPKAPTTTMVDPCTVQSTGTMTPPPPAVAAKLFDAKEEKIVHDAPAQVTVVSAVSSWFLPICGVFSLVAGISVFSMRRRAARSTRTLERQAVQFSAAASDEEPFLEM